jgi:vacuolar-type H+-ATPase subunit H
VSSDDRSSRRRQLPPRASEHIRAIVEVAERAAEAIIDDAEAQARRLLERVEADAERGSAERLSAISDQIDALLDQADAIRDRAERLAAALERVKDELDQEPSPARTTRATHLKAVAPDEQPDDAGARLLATQMAVSGSSREEIESRLRNGFEIEDTAAILDAILGPEDQS